MPPEIFWRLVPANESAQYVDPWPGGDEIAPSPDRVISGTIEALVGELVIGSVHVTAYGEQRVRNSSKPMVHITAKSVFEPKFATRKDGKSFGDYDPPAYLTRSKPKVHDLAGAKAYVEKLFLDMCAKARLSQEIYL